MWGGEGSMKSEDFLGLNGTPFETVPWSIVSCVGMATHLIWKERRRSWSRPRCCVMSECRLVKWG